MIKMVLTENDASNEGYVLERKNEEKVVVNKYTKSKDSNDLVEKEVAVLDNLELEELSISGPDKVLEELSKYTEGKDIFVKMEVGEYFA